MSDQPDEDDTDERIEREHENPDDATAGEDDVEEVPDGEQDLDEETDEWLEEEKKNPDDQE